jgi:ABC-type glycerol-3-phosphate transport system substrate-binding protein
MHQGMPRRRILLAGGAAAIGGLAAPALAQSAQIVRFLHNETDPPSIAFFNRAIAEFERQNPGVKIEMEVISTDGRLQKVTASMNARTMPEVFKILPEERFNFGRRGFLVQLDDVAEQIGRADFPATMLMPLDGKLYDLPYTIGNFSTMWYRADLLEEAGLAPPRNWSEYLAAARRLTRAPDMFGTVFPAGKNRMASIYFAAALWSAGGTFFDKDLNLTFDSPAAVQALEFLKELAAASPPGISSYSYSDMINTYMTGKVAIDIYAARLVANVAANTPALLPRTKAAPRPVGPSGVGVGFANSNSFAIASERVGARNIEAAKRFLAFIISGERSVDFSLTAFPHFIPPLASVRANARLLSGTPELAGRQDLAQASFSIADTLDFETEAGASFAGGRMTPSGVVNPFIGSIVARDIPALVMQRAVLQGQAPAEAVKWGAAEMQRVLADLRRR